MYNTIEKRKFHSSNKLTMEHLNFVQYKVQKKNKQNELSEIGTES